MDESTSNPPRRPAAAVVLWLADRYRDALAFAFAIIGPGPAYAFTRAIARLLYHLLPPIRAQSEFQIAAAARASGRVLNVPRVAEHAFVHRILDVTDVLLADRWLRPARLAALGDPLRPADRDALLAAQRRGQPVILVTAYYGPFDLLPLFLGYGGVRASILYRPHANPGFDRLRRRIRASAGCELVPVRDALQCLPRVLEQGGTIGVVADHHSERRGVETHFLGLPTRVPPTVGVLAARHSAEIVVAVMRRTGVYRFAIDVAEAIKPEAWAAEADPVAWITRQYVRALETLVWRGPSQYHWARARWGAALVQPLAEPIVRAQPIGPVPL